MRMYRHCAAIAQLPMPRSGVAGVFYWPALLCERASSVCSVSPSTLGRVRDLLEGLGAGLKQPPRAWLWAATRLFSVDAFAHAGCFGGVMHVPLQNEAAIELVGSMNYIHNTYFVPKVLIRVRPRLGIPCQYSS
jgi:hypothetical protein